MPGVELFIGGPDDVTMLTGEPEAGRAGPGRPHSPLRRRPARFRTLAPGRACNWRATVHGGPC